MRTKSLGSIYLIIIQKENIQQIHLIAKCLQRPQKSISIKLLLNFFQTLKLNSLQYDTFNTLSEMLIIHVVLVIKCFSRCIQLLQEIMFFVG